MSRSSFIAAILALVCLAGCAGSKAASSRDSESADGGECSSRELPADFAVIIFGDGNPDLGPAPLKVEFIVDDPMHSFIDPHFRWDFGDGSAPSDKRRPIHVYDRPGKYVARIVVTDCGQSDEDTVEIVVK